MSQSVAVIDRTYLRPSQKTLYKLIVEKLATGESISIGEAKHIWLTQVHAKHRFIDGKPTRTDYYVPDGEGYYTSRQVIMTEEEILTTSFMWLTSNIGILVVRGYLKVIPMIDVKQLETTSEPKGLHE